jgi:hypothetical protein
MRAIISKARKKISTAISKWGEPKEGKKKNLRLNQSKVIA